MPQVKRQAESRKRENALTVKKKAVPGGRCQDTAKALGIEKINPVIRAVGQKGDDGSARLLSTTTAPPLDCWPLSVLT